MLRLSLFVVALLALPLPALAERPSFPLSLSKHPDLPLLASEPAVDNPRADHPLLPVLQMAYGHYQHLQSNVQDYTARLMKREEIDGRLQEYEWMQLKVRHPRGGDEPVPFSVYLNYEGPPIMAGREVLYVRGKNDGQMIARKGGSSNFAGVTVTIDPDAPVAMRNNRYPVTEIGLLNLTQRLLEVGLEDLQHGECNVQISEGAKLNGRVCTFIEVEHPYPRDHFRYHRAQIFIDDELRVPIRYAAYDWPDTPGGEARLLEEYNYLNVQLNVGLTPQDFDRDNPAYKFSPERER